MEVVMDRRDARDLTQLKGQLWIVGIKIRGIGHLIKYQNAEYIAESEENAGIGEILCDLGQEIAEICDHFDRSITR